MIIRNYLLRREMPFTYKNQMTMEKTPDYFRKSFVPKRVFNMNRKIKLILIIREPAKRTVSTYYQNYRMRLSFKNNTDHFSSLVFDKNGSILIDDESSNIKRKGIPLISDSMYVEHLKEWLKYFPLEQILVLNGEEFIKNPYNEVIKVEKFLNLNKFFVPEHYIFDKNKGYYCMNKILFNSTENRCLGKEKGRKHSEIDENALDKLREFYKPYSLELFEILKQKPFWKI
jgi:hypothetical protein